MLARKALAGTAGAPKVYVEDVFSTYLYTGNGSTQTITNNIDLSTEGGLVWIKGRSSATAHLLQDSAQGFSKYLQSNSTSATLTGNYVTASTTGFSWAGASYGDSGITLASWTFRKAKKFFDVVTYTGDGSAQTINHNLGSVPGCIIVKGTSSATQWWVFHRSIGNTDALKLNGTDATTSLSTFWNNTSPTSTQFTVGTSNSSNGVSYVAYLFAHDAGGFGDAGSDSIIKCGSFTTDGSGNATIDLGWEPQFLITKDQGSAIDWYMVDSMRGLDLTTYAYLSPNASYADNTGSGAIWIPTATGFRVAGLGGATKTHIYIAIRRGPMKTPTSGTSVFSPVAQNAGSTVTTNFPVDLTIVRERAGVNDNHAIDRLRGDSTTSYNYLLTNTTAAEVTGTGAGLGFDNNTGFKDSLFGGTGYIYWNFRRAPGFFDVVCYTGNATARTISHNLGAVPELMIVKSRSSSSYVWAVYNSSVGATKYLRLNSNIGSATESNIWNDTAPTSSVFTVGTGATTNDSGGTYVAYLFASVSGVSKIGTYTGNGSSVTVTTDFQPRFIMVKRTDANGDWIVSDSARGLVAGNDPYLLLNSTAAEDTDEDWVDVSSTGFTVNQTTASNANVNTGTYIYLAIA